MKTPLQLVNKQMWKQFVSVYEYVLSSTASIEDRTKSVGYSATVGLGKNKTIVIMYIAILFPAPLVRDD